MKKKPNQDPSPFHWVFNKQLLAMKLSILLCFIGILNASAGLFSQSTNVSLSLKNKSVKEVLREVESLSQYRFFYNDDFLDLDRVISINVENNSVEHVLNEVFASAGVSYQVLENNLVVITPATLRQGHRVTGSVTDGVTGESLPGVTVMVEGTTTGVTTDMNGRYTIEVSDGNVTLIFSYLGYLRENILVNERNVIDLSLIPDLRFLDEVIVVGYGTMRRSDMTGSVVSIKEEDLRGSVATSLDMALQGRAAGVQVTPTSGQPGGGVSVRIRGASSIFGTNEPLYVIDGVPISGDSRGTAIGFDWAGGGNGQSAVSGLSGINPNDIVSVEILKDASATAIYGSRAANGVVMITTRQGQAGVPRVEYNTYVGLQQSPRKIQMLNLPEFAEYNNEFHDEHGWDRNPLFTDPSILGTGTNWQNEVFHNAVMHNPDVSISGGFDKTTFALSFGYMDQEGVVLGSGFNRISTRLSVQNKMYDWLEIGGNMSMGNTNERIVLNDDDRGIVSLALLSRPDIPVKMPDGSWGGPGTGMIDNLFNPVAMASIRDLELERRRIMSNLHANITLLEGLVFRTQFGSNVSTSNNYGFHPTYVMGNAVNTLNQSRRNFSNNNSWIFTNFLTYSKDFANFMTTQTMIGMEAQESNWEGMMGGRSSFVTNTVQELNAGDASTAINNQYKGSNSLLSYFGRLNLSFFDKYLLTATYRADASSNFSPKNQWGFFPSMAFAWKVSDEAFLENVNQISQLKLRLGYGQVGNQDIGGYTYGAALNNHLTRWGTGLLPNRYANPDVKWETTTSYNLGLDLSLFENRLEFIADLYLKQTTDMLMPLTLPLFMGASGTGSLTPPMVNVGEMENKGLELTLNTVNMDGNFQWTSGLTFTMNRNTLTRLYDDGNVIDRNVQWFNHATRSVVGEPLGQFYGYVVEGIFQDEQDILGHAKQHNNIGKYNGVWPGDLKFKDISGPDGVPDGIIDENDRTFIGNPNPDFTFALNNTFRYGGFDLNIYITGSYGNDILNYTRRITEGLSNNNNQTVRVVDRTRLELKDPEGSPLDISNVQVKNPGAEIPRLSSTDPNSNGRISTLFVEDGSFVKLKNLTLGYTLPNTVAANLGIKNARIYVNLQNLYTLTKYTGFDPEIGPYNQEVLLSGIDNGYYPSPRIYTLGLNVGF